MKIANLLPSKIIFFLVASTLILGLNLTPLVLQTQHSPSERTFALIHNNAQDFFFYQSLMNEGASGQWLTTDPYTSESHSSSFIFSYFLMMGKLAHFLHLPYSILYHLLRISLSILYLLFTFYFLLFLKIPFPRLTFLFFLFASPVMRLYNENGKIFPAPFMYWWTGMDPIRRAAYLPHHIFGALGLIVSLYLIIKYQKYPQIKYIICLSLIALFLAFIHTPSLFILLLIIPPAFIIYLIENLPASAGSRNLRENLKIKNYFGLFGYWSIGFLALFFMVSQTNHGFPWSQYIEWEKRFQFPLDKELIGALGILVPFSVIGLISALLSKKFISILIACWFFVPFLLIPFAPALGISNIRLIQGVPYLPLAILASLGLKTIFLRGASFFEHSHLFERATKNIWKDKESSRESLGGAQKKSSDLSKKQNLFLSLILILFFLFTLPTLSWSIKDQIKEFWPIYGNVYFDNRLTQTFDFINANFPPKTVSLSTFYTGNYLPAFTHTISFIGHSGYTYNLDKKQQLVDKFFNNNLADSEAKTFLSDNHITLIFQGPEEKPIYPGYLYPNLLKPVYDKQEATIYISNF